MLHLRGIHHDTRQMRAEFEPDLRAVSVPVGEDQIPDLLEREIDVSRLPLHRLRLSQAAQPAQDIAGANRLTGDFTQGRARVVLVGACPTEQPVAGLGVVGDRRQRLVELVRDAGRHFPDHRQPRDLEDTSVQLAE